MIKSTDISSDDPQAYARQRLLELSQERGASLASLSELIGRNGSYLQQFIRKGSPRKLEEGDRGILAEFFGIPESELGGGDAGAKGKILRFESPTR